MKDVVEKKEKKEEVDEMAVDGKDNENGKNEEAEKEDAGVSEKAKQEEKEEVKDNKLESNIWLRALSDEWPKHVDSVVTVGSASHFVAKIRMNSKNLIGKKRSTSDSEPHSLKNASTGIGLYWWRGGRLTRKLFNWKVLPRSLACKAARQGGGRKIDGILYPENSEYPKRTKAIA